MGGTPDLPSDWAFPETDDRHTLIFLAQFNLSDIAMLGHTTLPSEGMLYFFITGRVEKGTTLSHRILYYSSSLKHLRSTAQPPPSSYLPDPPRHFPTTYVPHSLIMLPQMTLPYIWKTSEIQSYLPNEKIPFKDQHIPAKYLDIFDALAISDEDSKLLGYGAEWDSDPRHGAAAHSKDTANQTSVTEWQLLFELVSHREANMRWWDMGFLQFLIPKKDLANRDFSRTYARIIST